jgi:CspA family cold shock protein
MEGIFKWYDREKGYGFIVGEDNKEYFVHYTEMPQGQDSISKDENLKVIFDVKETDRGVQASAVKLVE